MDGASAFPYPSFFSFPPYFTLQPVKETRDKQSTLWGELILSFCKHFKIFIIAVEEDSFTLFCNPSINRKLNLEARRSFLDDLVKEGNALWLDASHQKCLILWKKVQEWASLIHSFAKTYGLSDFVMSVEELSSGDDVRGTDLQGLHREILIRALKLLESQGKAKLFQGATPDEEGVKFI
ncbi:hypothetical protein CEUSTIGMA_g5485.t1 [Chlamydomonas eustigma]|uniref:ESCRT-II complex subunit VPS25 n=1 Tax=Chlamydomonas eustigma TaxID=1157962 RepID=A0A250X4N9_9CHLO|nr:hypothetical protein CEUSTIGMA_g5485.t1 [Chlamydomonas eustigma]|eukprot:GAX78043.1 hypothetical protein CEUSTIGMA_g5485.t1 [Chlamydomonas eustigma]